MTVSPGLGEVEVDPEQLVQLLTILLENAVNFSPDDSAVDVTAGSLENTFAVSVRDRGPGVPEGDLIFERFYQVDDVLHHSTPGVGLGLYIAREVVDAHGGSIECVPCDSGAEFRFTIPMGARRS